MEIMTTKERDKKIKELIIDCCESEFENEQKFNTILDELVEIYKEDNYRHRYDEITTVIISNHTNITQRGETASLMNVSKNLSKIYQKAEKNNIENNILKKIEKLYIHVNLECIRLKNFDEVDRKIKDYNKRTSILGDKIKKLDTRINNIEQQEQKITESLEKQQTQYITILGIFASIVLAFVGGLTFSNSVLANIDKASIYRLVFVMSFIALFIGNILYYLFDFLSKIAIRQKEEVPCYEKPIFCFNIIILIIMFVIVVIYYVRENQTHEINIDSSSVHNRIKSLNVCGKFDVNCIDVVEFPDVNK